MDRAIVERIAKLLELAKSPCNEHEAALAADKAKELLALHNLSLGEVELAAAPSAEEYFLCPARPARYLWTLVHSVEMLFDCAAVLTRDGIWGPHRMAICGVPQNVEAAALTLHYLQDSIKSLARGRQELLTLKRKNSRRTNLKRRMSYYYGAAVRIHSSICEAKARSDADAKRQAIVRVSNAIALRHLKEKHPGFKSKKAPRVDLDWRAFALGHSDGERIKAHGVHKALASGEETAR